MKTIVLPLNDRILARRVEAEEVTPGGLAIPISARERPQEAIVIAVGPGKYESMGMLTASQRETHYSPDGGPLGSGPLWAPVYRPMGVSPGDRILIAKYVGSEVSVGIETYLILREEEVLAILKDVEDEKGVDQ